MKVWKVALLAGALVAVGLAAAVAIAAGADEAVSGGRGASGADDRGLVEGQAHGCGEAGGGGRGVLSTEAAEELAVLHGEAMDAWHAQYGDDPESDAAQAALQRIRDDHRAAMQALTGGRGAGQAVTGHEGEDCDGDGHQDHESEDGYRQGGGNGYGGGAGDVW